MALFAESDRDTSSFPPFVLADMRGDSGKIVLVLPDDAFPDLTEMGYPATGHGLRGLYIAARVEAGLEGAPESIVFETEFDQCFALFSSEDDAETTAQLASAAFHDPVKLKRLAQLSLANDLY